MGGLAGVQPISYALHSCKATLLSWALQLRLPEEDRAKQRHHRSKTSHSVGLYGRDDVAQMLWVQNEIRCNTAQGCRPCCVQMRGALPPLEEPHVELQEATNSESDGEVDNFPDIDNKAG